MRRILMAVGVLVCCAASAFGAELDLTPLQRDLQFNFGNPGARALGMGGAFLGRADDASAAEANPAGLTIISKREFTIEARNRKVSSLFPLGVTVAPTTQSLDLTLPVREINASNTEVTFAAFAMPLGPVVVSAYYAVPLNYEQSATLTQAAIRQPVAGSAASLLAALPGDFTLKYKARSIGVAAAWKIGQFSIGAGAKQQSINLSSVSNTFGLNAASTIARDNVRSTATLAGDQNDIAYNLGFLWTSATEELSLGGVYKKGSTFDGIETTRRDCIPTAAIPIGNAFDALRLPAPSTNCVTASYNSPFQVPDRYGVGMSIRFPNGITLNEDIVRVKYSQLLPGFRSGIFCDLFTAAGYASASGTAPNRFCLAEPAGFAIEDVTEVHIGAEWLLPAAPIALRVGAWVDPAHRPLFDPSQAGTVNASDFTCKAARCQPVNTVFADAREVTLNYFRGFGGRQIHYSAGIGFLARAFEVHGGFDRSSSSSTFAVQLLTRF